MSNLEHKAADLRRVVDDIVHQFEVLDNLAANGPHVELSCQELRLVEFLGDRGPRMMRELAEHLLLAVNSITGNVDKLERKGFVRRERSEEDRRVVRVELTAAGRQAYEAAVAAKLRFLGKMLGALTEEEQEIFMVLFRKIARAGRSQVEKLSSPEAEMLLGR